MQALIIGLTERHGMAQEQLKHPPEGVEYRFLDYLTQNSPVLKSPMKGFMCKYDDTDCDLVEAVLTPANTRKPWLYSLARYEEAIAFSFCGLPLPKFMRVAYMNYLFSKPSFKGLLFWSEAGRQTLFSYGKVKNKSVIDKSYVVYPTIGQAPEEHIQYSGDQQVNFLFNGNFFIKGGANVVDVFEKLQQIYDGIKLRLCCDIDIDFHTQDAEMRSDYLNRIEKNPDITMGRVSRETFVEELLPKTDIYILPTYADAFGFAVLEAMSYGIPVVSTNYMAMPEIIEHEANGFLIDIEKYPCDSLFKGCVVDHLPQDFREDINQQLQSYLTQLIESPALRKVFGKRGIEICLEKFSIQQRQKKMSDIYKHLDLK